ncbi:MAG: hypothetical protein ACK4JX_00150 [Flavobacterium sp.]
MMVFPQGIENRVYNTLDISWAVAHSYANFKDLIWGVDFAFTHGPLSPLVKNRLGQQQVANAFI